MSNGWHVVTVCQLVNAADCLVNGILWQCPRVLSL